MELAIFLYIGLTICVVVVVGVFSVYARLWHWIFDKIEARRRRKTILRQAKQRERDDLAK
ncbi:hypothetical protein OIZ63_004335 [Salmonella enterica]|nr:hypothetical protein [Salmonella enterica]